MEADIPPKLEGFESIEHLVFIVHRTGRSITPRAALMISPWAKAGTIDHQVPSFDAYMKLIEDLSSMGNGSTPDGRAAGPRPT